MWKSIKHLLSMGIPMASARFFQTLTMFIIMIILAQMGHQVLAASLVISFLRASVILIFISPLFSLGSIIGRQVGARNVTMLPAIVQQVGILALCLAVPATAVLFCIEPILRFFHQPAYVVHIVGQYYHFAAFQLPMILLGTVCIQFLAGIKKQHILMITAAFSTITATFFTLGFGLGFFGFPKIGVQGVGLGVLISSSIYCCNIAFFALKHLRTFGPIFRFYCRGMQWFKLVLRFGMPISAQIASEMLSLRFLIFMIGWLGPVALAGSQVSSQYILFAIMPIVGLSEAAAVRVGHAYGEKNWIQVRRLGFAGALMAIVFTGLIGLIFAIFHRPLAGVFIHFGAPHAQHIYTLTLWLLLIRIVSMFFGGVTNMLCGALRGIYDTKFPMGVSLISNWLLMLPLAGLFGFGLHLGAIGTAVGSSAARISSAFVLLGRWRWQMRQLSIASNPA